MTRAAWLGVLVYLWAATTATATEQKQATEEAQPQRAGSCEVRRPR